MTSTVKIYGYRWVVLLAFMFVVAMNQLLWITFAPITSTAVRFYHTTNLMVGLLSMMFMIIYIAVVLPSAWVIDTWGFRVAVGIGAALTGVGALARGLFAANFAVVFAAQVGIAVGQPFILGAITKLAARWFPKSERATATGLGTLAMYLGILGAMLITPALTLAYSIPGMLMTYGLVAAASAVVFLVAARGAPRTPPGPPGEDERALMFDGLRSMLRQKDFWLLLVIFFIGLGMFNGISTWIEEIVRPRGFSISQAGLLGGLMLVGGITGAVVVPMVSDKLRRRKPFVVIALAGLLPGLVGMTFARGYWLLLVSGFIFGFFLLSAGPIGFQYGAELTHPAPEGTSNSLLLLMGQISGIIFIFGMDVFKSAKTGAMTVSLLVLLGLTVLSVILSALLRESPIRGK